MYITCAVLVYIWFGHCCILILGIAELLTFPRHCITYVISLISRILWLRSHIHCLGLTLSQSYQISFLLLSYSEGKMLLFFTQKSYKLLHKFVCRIDSNPEEYQGLTTNAVHPGLVMTEVTRNFNWFVQLGNFIATPFLATVQKTARYFF